MFKYILLTFLITFINIVITFEVVEWTDDDFNTNVKESQHCLVMFYAPWCSHCKKLKPEFDKAASILIESEPPVTLAKVDCTAAGKSTCTTFSVGSFPTLKIFEDGEMVKEYSGPREAAGMVKYMKTEVGPDALTIKSLSQLEKVLDEPDVTIIGFFKEDAVFKILFIQVAGTLKDKFKFAVTTAEELLEKYDVVESKILLFRPKHLHNKFEPNELIYEGSETFAGLKNWIKTNQHGLVDHRTRENMEEFEVPLIVAYYKVDYIKNPKGTNYWRNRILKVAKNYAEDYTFAISSKDDFQHELNEFGYDYVPSDKPLVFARSKDYKKYIMADEFSIENFENFIQKLKAGEIEPYLKSESIPESNDGPVKVAVAKNFDDVVTNSNKDTFIEFYAPWCGHCKKLTPIWDELGKKMTGEDVDIVKMDATNNDVPLLFDVRGFPTLFWVPKNDKQNPVPYNGGRDLNEFIKYIAKQSTDELKKYDRSGNPKSKDEL